MSVNGALRIAAALAGGSVSDPNWSSVSLLAHFDNNWTDAKGIQTLTPTNAVLSATQSKFGGYAGYWDGSGDYVNSGSSSALAFGNGNFTVECWIYVTSLSTSRTVCATRGTGATTAGWSIGIINTGEVRVWANGPVVQSANGAVTVNNWYHIAVTRAGTTTRVFVNGTQSGSSGTNSDDFSNQVLCIGSYVSNNGGTEPFAGYIDDLRITKGVARYTGNFTPPTAAFPNS